MKYEKPGLQEIELLLEGSFLDPSTTKPGDEGVGTTPDPDEGDNPGIWG